VQRLQVRICIIQSSVFGVSYESDVDFLVHRWEDIRDCSATECLKWLGYAPCPRKKDANCNWPFVTNMPNIQQVTNALLECQNLAIQFKSSRVTSAAIPYQILLCKGGTSVQQLASTCYGIILCHRTSRITTVYVTQPVINVHNIHTSCSAMVLCYFNCGNCSLP